MFIRIIPHQQYGQCTWPWSSWHGTVHSGTKQTLHWNLVCLQMKKCGISKTKFG